MKKNRRNILWVLMAACFYAQSSAAAVSATNLAEEEYGKPRGIAGDVTFGPSMSLLSVPHPLSVGIEAKYKNMFGFGVNYGFIPELRFRGTTAKIQAISAAARWFPFGGAFFVGMKVGNQTISARKTTTILNTNVEANVEVNSGFYTPQAGWRWVWPTGFFMGVDLGWQIASGADTTVTTNIRNAVILATSQYAQIETDVKKVGNDLGNTALPSMTLLQFGWLF